MAFGCFQDCLAVRCGARDKDGKLVAGCGKDFCGACMVPYPCPKRCGHSFKSIGELHTLWQVWRRERVQQYLKDNFRNGPKDKHSSDDERERMLTVTLRGVRSDLVAAGINPLGGGFPDPK